jgi:hypothetical protein
MHLVSFVGLTADREVTAAVMWFYINLLYFPYDAQFTAQREFNEWFQPIKIALIVNPETSTSEGELPELVEKLQEQSAFTRFKELLQARLDEQSEMICQGDEV